MTSKYQQDNKPDDKPKLEVASWQEEVEGKQVTRYAFIDEAEYTTEESLEAAKAKIFEKFLGYRSVRTRLTITRLTVWSAARARMFR